MGKSKILLIYTGGTIGMMTDPATGSLKPFDFTNILKNIPDLNQFDIKIDYTAFDVPVDSSDISVKDWQKLVGIIKRNYTKYDGFVILHGTDTMAFTGSALSFMMQNINKPVIVTGSQLPIGMIRTDGKENLITSIQIAADKFENGKAKVPEVCIYFDAKLYRANRTTKFNANYFDAFMSPNYPPLAEAGIDITYFNKNIFYPQLDKVPNFYTDMDNNVAIITLFPGLNLEYVKNVLNTPGLKAVILETYGAGNAPTSKEFLSLVEKAVRDNIIVYNVTQCSKGTVNMDRYENGRKLKELGVVSGKDITLEAAVTKLMFLLGLDLPSDTVKIMLEKNIAGEISE